MTTAVATYQYRTSRVAMGTFFLLLGAAFLMDSMGVFRVTAALFWPLFVIAMGSGLLLRRARQLQVEEDRSAQLAVAEERVRIARELHDIVAHGVSLMTIQIAAARRVGATKPDSAQESLEAAEQTGRQTLSELEGMLAVLRGADASIGAAAARSDTMGGPGGGPASSPRTPLPRIADVAALVDTLRQTGRTVSYSTLGDPPALPASVEMVVYRVVQEAITNSVRYGGGTPIDVQLIFAPNTITVFVDDEGVGPSGPGSWGAAAGTLGSVATPGASTGPSTDGAAVNGAPAAGAGPVTATAPTGGGGHGLVGMQERLAAIGGTLEAGPRVPGPGWRVQASIPVVLISVA